MKLESGEKIKENLKQTGLVLVEPILLTIVAIIIPWYLVLKYSLYASVGIIAWLFTLFLIIHIANIIIKWQRTHFIITNKRIVYIKASSIFAGTTTEAYLNQIVSLKQHTPSAFAKILDYGNLEITLTGATDAIIVNKLANPEEIKSRLWACVTENQQITQRSQIMV